MEKFMRKFTQLNGKKAKILLEHCLFEKQLFHCEVLQTINDDKRIGLVLRKQDIFMYKQDIKLAKNHDNMYIISDGKFTITIIVNKM